jgi:hypothetical protein
MVMSSRFLSAGYDELLRRRQQQLSPRPDRRVNAVEEICRSVNSAELQFASRRSGESEVWANLKQVLKRAIAAGFEPIDPDDHAILLIEYAIKGMGTVKDLDKRHALEYRMNETLGWTGLGHCDGGSIGSGTMEVCCYVVDFETARRVVEKDLKGTKFANYSRIFDERAAEPDDAPAPRKGPAAAATVMYAPPWHMYQSLDRKDARWQKGKPAQYLAKWTRWFQKTPAPAQAAYATIFREPKGWSSFYKSVASAAK